MPIPPPAPSGGDVFGTVSYGGVSMFSAYEVQLHRLEVVIQEKVVAHGMTACSYHTSSSFLEPPNNAWFLPRCSRLKVCIGWS